MEQNLLINGETLGASMETFDSTSLASNPLLKGFSEL